MKAKDLNNCDGKKYIFSRFYIIKNDYIFSTSNQNFDCNLKNCYCIKKLGSDVNPKIYLDIKKDNKIINKNKFIGNYQSLMDFIAKNRNSFIFIKGFSIAGIAEFLKMINEKKQLNIKPVKFKNKVAEAQYERHLAKKEQRIEELKERLENVGEIETAEQYMKISNYVFGKDRCESRQKILKLQRK